MTQERKQITGHMLACGTQIMWGATFVSTKVLLQYFIPVEVLFTRAVLAFLAMVSWGFYSALIKKIAEWDYSTIAVTRRIYFYAILFLIPVLIVEHASWNPEVLAKPVDFCAGIWQPSGSAWCGPACIFMFHRL